MFENVSYFITKLGAYWVLLSGTFFLLGLWMAYETWNRWVERLRNVEMERQGLVEENEKLSSDLVVAKRQPTNTGNRTNNRTTGSNKTARTVAGVAATGAAGVAATGAAAAAATRHASKSTAAPTPDPVFNFERVAARWFAGEEVAPDSALGVVYTSPPADADDLTKIDGIDAVKAVQLNRAGIFKFKQFFHMRQAAAEVLRRRFEWRPIDLGYWQRQAASIARRTW